MEDKEHVLLQEFIEFFVRLDEEEVKNKLQALININVSHDKIVNNGLMPALKTLGDKFGKGELFIPDLIMSGELAKEVMAKIYINSDSDNIMNQRGVCLLASVKGDVHDIGKNLVGNLLTAYGFKVVDIGVDCTSNTILEKAMDIKADIIGLSALLTVTIPEQRNFINLLKEKGIRNQFRVLVGGAAVDPIWANEIGADGYGANMQEAVDEAVRLCAKEN